MSRLNYSRYYYVAFLALLTVIVYIPSLDIPFVFDDLPNIVLNLDVHAEEFSELGRSLGSRVAGRRPLAMFSFAVNHWLGGLDVFGYHVFNILIHVLNGILLYQLLLIIPTSGKSSISRVNHAEHLGKIAFWAAALWLVNPVQTQAVTYLVQRMTSMATLFYLSGLYIFISWRSGKLSTHLAMPLLALSFGLGLACKEIMLTMPVALILCDFIFFPVQWRKNMPFILGLLALTLFLGVFYLGSLPEWQTRYPNRNFSPLERVMTQWRVFWHYLSLYILPIPDRLHLTYNIEVSRGLFSPWTTIPALVAIIISIVSGIKLRHKFPVISWAMLFFILALVPESSFVNLELAFIHRLYLPSLFLVFAVLYYIPPNVMKKSGLLLLLLIGLWSYWTIARNDEWQVRENFWSSNIQRGAETARAKNNLATALIDAGRFSEAMNSVEEGLEIVERDEDLKLLLYNQACIYFYQKKYNEALAAFQQTSRKFGSFMHTSLFIGQVYLKQGRSQDAVNLANELQKVESLRYQGEIIKATILEEENRSVEAIDLLIATLTREADSQIYIRQKVQPELAKIYMKNNQLDEAYRIFVGITEEFPQNYSVWKIIYRMQVSGGDYESADKVRAFLESRGIKIKKALSRNDPDRATN